MDHFYPPFISDGSYIKAESIKVRVKGGAEDLAVNKVIVHKEFIYDTFKNDVALLELAEPAENRVPICLPENMGTLVYQKLKTSWWEGDVFEENAVGRFFTDAVKSKSGLDACKSKIAAQSISYSLDTKNICTGSSSNLFCRLLFSVDEKNALGEFKTRQHF